MSEERFIDIETKLAHQDQTIFELNNAITNQQASIIRLEKLCASMAARIASLNEALPGAEQGDERPPHY